MTVTVAIGAVVLAALLCMKVKVIRAAQEVTDEDGVYCGEQQTHTASAVIQHTHSTHVRNSALFATL